MSFQVLGVSGGGLFMGRFDFSAISPFPVQSAKDRLIGDALVEKVRVFLETSVDADLIDREDRIPSEVMKGLKELDLFGMKIPVEYGGLGLSQTNYNRVIKLLGSHSSALTVLLSAHQSIGVPQPLLLFGTQEQKEKYLPRLAAGGDLRFHRRDIFARILFLSLPVHGLKGSPQRALEVRKCPHSG